MVIAGRYFRSALPPWKDGMWAGTGSLYTTSRWLPAGHAVVYAASSPSLAVLEMLVNAPKPWPAELFFSSVELPFPLPAGMSIDRVNAATLPTGWRKLPRAPGPLWDIGQEFIASSHLGLVVPSAVLPLESNLILKAGHPAFAALAPTAPAMEQMDERLVA